MTSQLGEQTIIAHILPNISRSKCNQAMKFHQFIEYNTKNIFLEKPFTERGEKTSPRPFSEKLNLNIFLDQQSKILYCIPS